MNKCPKIGTRVQLKPSHRFGAVTGVVMAIYPTHDDHWNEDTDVITNGPLRPESQWHVGVKVDKPLPSTWSYPDTDRFAPEVSELVRIKS